MPRNSLKNNQGLYLYSIIFFAGSRSTLLSAAGAICSRRHLQQAPSEAGALVQHALLQRHFEKRRLCSIIPKAAIFMDYSYAANAVARGL
jgi:hypothetical protein